MASSPARQPAPRTFEYHAKDKVHEQDEKAAIVEGFGEEFQVKDAEIPEPGPGQVLVKLIASGVCHTDLHAAEGDWPVKPKLPLIPGHEGVGIVEKLGEGVTEVALGDMIGNAWLASACGHCQYCRTGWETLCEAQSNGGYSVDGSFGQYMLVDSRYAAHIPEGSDSHEIAPVLCAGVTVFKGLKMTEVKPGQWVAISGIGGLGHIAVQYAVAMGMRVIAIDVADDKLALASKHGAEITVNAFAQDPAEIIQQKVGGTHGVLVTAVHPKAFGQAIGMTRRGERSCSTGCPPVISPHPFSTSCSRA